MSVNLLGLSWEISLEVPMAVLMERLMEILWGVLLAFLMAHSLVYWKDKESGEKLEMMEESMDF